MGLSKMPVGSPARFAGASSLRVKIRIFCRKGVSSLAVGFDCIQSGSTHRTKFVDTWRHGFKVAWTNACTRPTQVIKFQSSRDRTDHKFIRHAMGSIGSLRSGAEVAITSGRVAVRRPQPALAQIRAILRDRAILVDLFPKQFLSRRLWQKPESSHIAQADVVRSAIPASLIRLAAAFNRTDTGNFGGKVYGTNTPQACPMTLAVAASVMGLLASLVGARLHQSILSQYRAAVLK